MQGRGMHIILCGLPKSGKTTLGKMVAETLHSPFIDTDQLIEKHYCSLFQLSQITCREIMQQKGEDFFRKIEKEQINNLPLFEPSVISLGGGSLLDEENQKMVLAQGVLFYLKTPLRILWNRISSSGLPAFLTSKQPKKEFFAIASTRQEIYERISDYKIETNNITKKEIVKEIIKKI